MIKIGTTKEQKFDIQALPFLKVLWNKTIRQWLRILYIGTIQYDHSLQP